MAHEGEEIAFGLVGLLGSDARFLQFVIAFLDLGEHVVEGIDEGAHFIIAVLLGAERVIFVLGNVAGGLREFQNRPGNHTLKAGRDEQSNDRGQYQDCRDHSHMLPEPGGYFVQIGVDIARSDDLIVWIQDWRKHVQAALIKARAGSVGGRFLVESGGISRLGELRQDIALFVINAGGDNPFVGSEVGQNILGALGTVHGDKYGAVLGGDFGHERELLRHRFAVGGELVADQDHASGEQGDAARQHDHQRHFAPDGEIINESHLLRLSLVLIFKIFYSCEQLGVEFPVLFDGLLVDLRYRVIGVQTRLLSEHVYDSTLLDKSIHFRNG